jgi:hypothetical protein
MNTLKIYILNFKVKKHYLKIVRNCFLMWYVGCSIILQTNLKSSSQKLFIIRITGVNKKIKSWIYKPSDFFMTNLKVFYQLCVHAKLPNKLLLYSYDKMLVYIKSNPLLTPVKSKCTVSCFLEKFELQSNEE